MENLQTIHPVSEDFFAGMTSVRGLQRPPDWDSRLAKLVAVMENHQGLNSIAQAALVAEAASSSDFPLLLGDTIDRQLAIQFRLLGSGMSVIARRAVLRNFNTVKRGRINGLMGPMQIVEELGEYPQEKLAEGVYSYALKKRGKVVPFSLESYLNDDLGIFDTIPAQLAMSAATTRDRFLTTLFWNSNGPLDAFFAHSTLGQKGVSNLPLTADNLGTAIAQMTGSGATSGYVVDGSPMVNVPKYLVVCPALQILAMQILESAALAYTGTSTATLPTLNVLGRFNLTLIVDPWLPLIVTSGTKGQTTWALFSETIPAAEIGYLAGHEEPELFIQSSNAIGLGGAASASFNGNFYNDAIAYKMRYIFDGVALDPRGGWASDGQ